SLTRAPVEFAAIRHGIPGAPRPARQRLRNRHNSIQRREATSLLEQKSTILVLAPHTDDGELGCGGSIARFIREGHEVHYVAFCKIGRASCRERQYVEMGA